MLMILVIEINEVQFVGRFYDIIVLFCKHAKTKDNALEYRHILLQIVTR